MRRRLIKWVFLASVMISFTAFTVNGSEIKWPEDKWNVNNFKQKNCGADIAFMTAPDGSNAIKIKFFGEQTSNAIMPPKAILEQRNEWPDSFAGFYGYFWNNGSMNVANISLRTGDGVKEKFQQYNARTVLQR